ncbi:MAG: NAD-dependent epimerase/dehydratase family protein [Pyrinomonadaceae bacterium]
MLKRILITGGAGFIGSHLCDELLKAGYDVRAFDNLTEQVHGPDAARPEYLNSDVELIVGDVRDAEAVSNALEGIDAVFHFAAKVGVGQSMYEIAQYTSVNNGGTAVLLQVLAERPVERLIVASSMSVYGEGLYANAEGLLCGPVSRTREQLQTGNWEAHDANGHVLIPVPTPESKPPTLSSIYALSKFDQERMCLLVGSAYHIPTVALRFFNVYGPRQALSNPYTGVLAIFASRLLNGNKPIIFEDGQQRRDFVNVADVARACRLALESPSAANRILNIGSGHSHTVCDIARRMAQVMKCDDILPEITGEYRVGDIRHCFADISAAREVLGFHPQVLLTDGIAELATWLTTQVAIDRVGEHRQELAARGLTL